MKGPRESLRQFFNRFEAALKLVSNPKQFTAYAAFVKGLVHDLEIRTYPIVRKLVMIWTKKVSGCSANHIPLVKLETMQSTCVLVNLKAEPTPKRTRFDKAASTGAKLPLLTTTMTQIYELKKEYGYWKSSQPLKTPSEKRNCWENYEFH